MLPWLSLRIALYKFNEFIILKNPQGKDCNFLRIFITLLVSYSLPQLLLFFQYPLRKPKDIHKVT